jgi:fumarylacetoacetate (FAA) hydrolase
MRLGTFRDPDRGLVIGEVEGERVQVLKAPRMVVWLAGEGRQRTGVELELASLTTLAPVPEPPSVRDFYSFERHVQAGARLRGREVADHWYQAPAFYFSNPASILGPGEALRRPSWTQMLDFELELAAVIGVPLGSFSGADAPEIAGFTLMNDWSARDVQAGEITVGLGPHKAKDFGTSLGPYLVTPDDLPYEDGRLRVAARAELNGEGLTASDASEQHFSWPEIVAHAARDTRLRPGDVLGSGTLAEGCLLELGPLPADDRPEGRWIEPGDVVALEADGLGRLETPVQ